MSETVTPPRAPEDPGSEPGAVEMLRRFGERLKRPWEVRVGLALGGGAARGLAHIGVIRALEREGLRVHVVAGTSMGALIGGAYAATGDIGYVERRVREYLSSEEFKKNRILFLRESRRGRKSLFYSVANLVRRGIVYGVSSMKPSFMSAEEFARSMAAVLPDVDIEDLPIPFAAVALDLEAAEEVVIRRGRLRSAVAASSAIPGLIPPVFLDGRVLVDGGWVDKVPVIPCFAMGADVVVAVDISAELEDTADYSRGVDIMARANAIRDTAFVRFLCRLADHVVEPAVKEIHWADFGAVDSCIRAGDEAMSRALPDIRELTRRARLQGWIRPRLGRRLAEFFLADSHIRFTIV